MQEKLKINKDNYKGYTELFRLIYGDLYCANNKQITKELIYVCAGVTIFIPAFIFIECLPLCTLFFIGYEIYPQYKRAKNHKKIKQDLKSKYPYINVEVDDVELKNSLENLGILLKNSEGHYYINIENYERRFFSSKMWDSSDFKIPKYMKRSFMKRFNASKKENNNKNEVNEKELSVEPNKEYIDDVESRFNDFLNTPLSEEHYNPLVNHSNKELTYTLKR